MVSFAIIKVLMKKYVSYSKKVNLAFFNLNLLPILKSLIPNMNSNDHLQYIMHFSFLPKEIIVCVVFK